MTSLNYVNVELEPLPGAPLPFTFSSLVALVWNFWEYEAFILCVLGTGQKCWFIISS